MLITNYEEWEDHNDEDQIDNLDTLQEYYPHVHVWDPHEVELEFLEEYEEMQEEAILDARGHRTDRLTDIEDFKSTQGGNKTAKRNRRNNTQSAN